MIDRSWGRGAKMLLAGAGLTLCVACSAEVPYEPEPAAVEPPPTVESTPPASDTEYSAHTAEHRDDDSHDEDNGEYAGGEAHVHGAAELAVALDTSFVTITVDAPLVNYGLSEKTKKKSTELEKYAEGLTELMGNARCDLVERSAEVRRSGDHAALTLSIVWDCKRPSQLDGLMFTGFEHYPAFEEVDAIYLGEEGESNSASLTPDSPFLPFGS
ncbi:DUF2796 domain-containing protein [uncultured Hyphomonas sp.]|uniref:ZrgA family zinc uptake protein n=1 Tax=uncultured Hyphomonas sp. TaxID=225298 RepID=UPI002610F8EF|nr:DUF2796 domain-containing protein [uncultured Hyphomonas sp.]